MSRRKEGLSPGILHPAHPERVCWGCDKYCPADDLRCGNGSERTQHPSELLGDDWDAVPVKPDKGAPGAE